MKLTIKQNAVIYHLQNGAVIITDSDYKGAVIANRKQYRINNGLFWRLVKMNLIYQTTNKYQLYDYVLTPLGESIKTKKVDMI